MQRTLMVLVSGAGTTLANLCEAIDEKRLNARIAAVISNHVNIPAADVAKKNKLSYFILDPKIYPSPEKWDVVFQDFVSIYKPTLIVCAGFDRKLVIPIKYEKRIINIHPSLLPKYGGKGFYGNKVHQAVLAGKEKLSGCTVHLVNEEYDKGKVIAQETVEVLPDDSTETLKKRVQELERRVYPKIIESYLDDIQSKIK